MKASQIILGVVKAGLAGSAIFLCLHRSATPVAVMYSPSRGEVVKTPLRASRTLAELLKDVDPQNHQQLVQDGKSSTQCLSPDEVGEIIDWIKSLIKNDQLDEQKLRYVDHVMDVLDSQTSILDTWDQGLIEIVSNEGLNGNIRNLTISHLIRMLEPNDDDKPCVKDLSSRDEIVTCLMGVAGNAADDLSGRALAALDQIISLRSTGQHMRARLNQLPLKLSEDDLRPLAISLSLNPASSPQNRVEAFQICSARGYREVLPIMRRAAVDKSSDYVVRIDAINGIARLGGRRDEALLRVLENDEMLIVRKTSSEALKTLILRDDAEKMARL